MEIDWTKPVFLGLPLNVWAATAIGALIPYILRGASAMTSNTLRSAAKDFDRTLFTLLMLAGGGMAFWYADNSPITGNEALRMIIGAILYIFGFQGLTDLNKREPGNRKEQSKAETPQAARERDTK